MHADYFLDRVPVLLFFIAFILLALLPIEVGQWLGARRRQKTDHEPEGPVGNVVGAKLALLAFMMALTVGAAISRFDNRKEALIDGVNAIETAYRNASLLPEPHKSESRKLLREHVEIRLEMHQLYGNPEELRKVDTHDRAIQQALWLHAEALAKEDRSSEIYALFTASLNEVLQIHNKRVIIDADDRDRHQHARRGIPVRARGQQKPARQSDVGPDICPGDDAHLRPRPAGEGNNRREPATHV